MAGEREPAGILALQGDFADHAAALGRLGLACREVRGPGDIEGLSGLVLPGGESTTMLRLLEATGLEEPLVRWVASGRPVLATCAGLILLAEEVTHPPQRGLGLLRVAVARNAYGRQLASGVFALRGEGGFPDTTGSFIRAPRILRTGEGVEVLAWRGGDPVLVRQGGILAATFHPEMDGRHPALDLWAASLGAVEANAHPVV